MKRLLALLLAFSFFMPSTTYAYEVQYKEKEETDDGGKKEDEDKADDKDKKKGVGDDYISQKYGLDEQEAEEKERKKQPHVEGGGYITTGDDNRFFTPEDTTMHEVFDMSLKDVDVENIVSFLLDFKSMTVIKKVGDNYIGYFNTPNVSTAAKTQVVKDIADGYEGTTFDINEKERLVDVGTDTGKDNVITRYGFALPSNHYDGEYPLIYMTTKGMLPTDDGKIKALWKGIKSFITGESFIDLPEQGNLESLYYYNHRYFDTSEQAVKWVKKHFYNDFLMNIDTRGLDLDKISNKGNEGKGEGITPDQFQEMFDKEDDAPSYDELKKLAKKKIKADEETFDVIMGWLAGDNAEGQDDYMSYLSASAAINTFKDMKKEGFLNEYLYSSWASATSYYSAASYKDRAENASENLRKIMKVALTKPHGTVVSVHGVMPENGYASSQTSENAIYVIDEFKWAHTLPKGGNIGMYGAWSKDLSGGNTLHATVSESKLKKAVEEKPEKGKIGLGQCLITTEGKKGTCVATAHSDEEASIFVAAVLRQTNVVKIAKDNLKEDGTLTRKGAIKVINELQDWAGPYFPETLNGSAIVSGSSPIGPGDDDRVMPYDVSALATRDAENYEVTDPRTEMYLSTLVGSLVGKAQVKLSLPHIGIETAFIRLNGMITELSVFFQQICNFATIEGFGIDATQHWSKGLITVAAILFTALFIFQTVKSTFVYVLTGNTTAIKILSSFLLFFFEITALWTLAGNPNKVYETLKTTATTAINIGEMSVVGDQNKLKYLYGKGKDFDASVTYYMPYLDAWSSYNTGYSIFNKKQVIDFDEKVPEVKNIKKNDNLPKIDKSDIKHWSILLADSFSYYGQSSSLSTNYVKVDGKRVNGQYINNNAYRVVDHFMAPRFSFKKADAKAEGWFGIERHFDTIKMTNAQNEYFNNQFQKKGIATAIQKLMVSLLICLLSFLKVLLFLWFFYQIYSFVFGFLFTVVKGESIRKHIATLLMPIPSMMLVGSWAGVCMRISGEVEGLSGLAASVFLFWATFKLINAWESFGDVICPKPVGLFAVFFKTIGKEMKPKFMKKRQRRKEARDIRHKLDNGEIEPDEARELLKQHERGDTELPEDVLNDLKGLSGTADYDFGDGQDESGKKKKGSSDGAEFNAPKPKSKPKSKKSKKVEGGG